MKCIVTTIMVPLSSKVCFIIDSHAIARRELMYVSAGTDRTTVFANTPFQPIRFHTNAGAILFTIEPALPEGMQFDNATGIISGVYRGVTTSVTYHVTATDKQKTVESSLTIDYKSACVGIASS